MVLGLAASEVRLQLLVLIFKRILSKKLFS